MLGFWVDTESMMISLPQWKADDFAEWLGAWLPEKLAIIKHLKRTSQVVLE